ncbi:MAG: phosphate ABC transporter permease PstA [Actinobacteria bacterium]|nr:phosphate ABC transporter permease PstA [Actinomycetota bacterium]
MSIETDNPLPSKEKKITPQPQTPWKTSGTERASSLIFILAAAAASYMTVALTPMKGILPLTLLFFIFAALFSFIRGNRSRGIVAGQDSAAGVVMAIGMFVALLPIASILYTTVSKGLPGLHRGLLFNDMSAATPTDPITEGGLSHAIVGTFVMVMISLAIALPLGLLTAIYITEIRGRFTRPIRFLVQAMSGVPSIVAGLFILSAFVYPITKTFSGLMGSLALSILMIPTIARTAEEVLRLIPEDLREAGLALGGTQWRTVAMVVVPAARSGLVTAVILGIARVAGETAPILLLTGGGDQININPVEGAMGSLPFYIWKSFFFGSEEAVARGWAGLLVLLTLVLILFATARFFSTRKVR